MNFSGILWPFKGFQEKETKCQDIHKDIQESLQKKTLRGCGQRKRETKDVEGENKVPGLQERRGNEDETDGDNVAQSSNESSVLDCFCRVQCFVPTRKIGTVAKQDLHNFLRRRDMAAR